MNVRIYADGAATSNPDGPGSYGTILEYTDQNGGLHTREISQVYRKMPNNRKELMAATAGLEALDTPCKAEVYLDSKCLADAFNQYWIESWIANGWKRGKNESVKNNIRK